MPAVSRASCRGGVWLLWLLSEHDEMVWRAWPDVAHFHACSGSAASAAHGSRRDEPLCRRAPAAAGREGGHGGARVAVLHQLQAIQGDWPTRWKSSSALTSMPRFPCRTS